MSPSNGSLRSRLLQSPEEWSARNRILADSLARLISRYMAAARGLGLDVGCQTGDLTDHLNDHTSLRWEGIDPVLSESGNSPRGAVLHPGSADCLPYPDEHFDCLVFANVYEHIPPERRSASLREMYRVLRPGGIVVGQLPNPYFLIESHSRLPLMGWLPPRLQKRYWRLAPVPWGHDFYSVTIRDLRREAERAGFGVVDVSNFNYPPEAYPRAIQRLAAMLEWPMRRYPWAWQFVLSRPGDTGTLPR